MIRLAQILITIRSNEFYFPVGYEFESAHGSKNSWDNFENGAKEIMKSVVRSFGMSGKPVYGVLNKEGSQKEAYSFYDDGSQLWRIVPEYIREDYSTADTGWETVTPPFFNPDHLRNLASFILQLGYNKFGRSAELTGGHQTYQAFPPNLNLDKNTKGLILANYLLLKEQFVPEIFKLLEVERYGGPKNFFLRPIIMDHLELLKELSQSDPKLITPERIEFLLMDKYALREFAAHVKYSDNYEDDEKVRMMNWADEKKKKYPKLWKYRDTRVKFFKNDLVLLEDRLGEFRSGEPGYSLTVTLFNQLLLSRAIQMAQQGILHQLVVPERLTEDDDSAYWSKLSQNTKVTRAELFNTLGIDSNTRALLAQKKFKTQEPEFKVLKKPSWGFEMEFVGHQFVDIVVPKEAKARAEWHEKSRNEKIKYVASLIADETGQKSWLEEGYLPYSADHRRIVIVEFEADTLRFPFLDPELFQEDSGNFEIKSNGRDVFQFKVLKKQIQEISKIVSDYGMHVHLFVPDQYLKIFRERPDLAEKATSLLERVSLFMTIVGYDEVKPKNNYHALDSWSLDRYSPKDLKQVMDWLRGLKPLDNYGQKYHNIGFRVVRGGLDLEGRDLGSDLELAEKVMLKVHEGFVEKKFVNLPEVKNQPDLFYEFRDYKSYATSQYTLEYALSRLYAITEQQKAILRKLQFEIYKPSMNDYMRFKGDFDWNSVDPADLDPAYARTNFESNVVIPLWNFESQGYISEEELRGLQSAKQAYLEKVYKLVLKIQNESQFEFLVSQDNFLYLAEWMSRSTHPNKPNLKIVGKNAAAKQRVILEDLVYELRSYVVAFVHHAKLKKTIDGTFNQDRKSDIVKMSCERLSFFFR
jgi:hypothetical protein